jgi:hypothetical protein
MKVSIVHGGSLLDVAVVPSLGPNVAGTKT